MLSCEAGWYFLPTGILWLLYPVCSLYLLLEVDVAWTYPDMFLPISPILFCGVSAVHLWSCLSYAASRGLLVWQKVNRAGVTLLSGNISVREYMKLFTSHVCKSWCQISLLEQKLIQESNSVQTKIGPTPVERMTFIMITRPWLNLIILLNLLVSVSFLNINKVPMNKQWGCYNPDSRQLCSLQQDVVYESVGSHIALQHPTILVHYW